MTWDQFVANFKDFWNQPVPIIGVTIGTLFIFVMTIISKTSIGKKSLKTLKGLYEDLKLKIELALTNFDKKAKEVDETLLKQNEYLKNELELAKEKYQSLELLVFEIAQTIPNKKVHELVNKYIGVEEKVEE